MVVNIGRVYYSGHMDRIAKTSIKAVVFDLDGVIVDSMPMIARGIQEVVKGFGINISADEILSTYIQPREEFYKSIGVKINNMEELYARHASAVKKHLVGARLFDDVVSTLTQLQNKGLTLGIASHQTMSNIQNEIERLGFQKFFASENALGGHKSKPEKLTELVAQFGIASHRVLFVGDLPSDITAAKKAGVQSAAIARHESGKARLKAERPDYFLDSLSDLLTIL